MLHARLPALLLLVALVLSGCATLPDQSQAVTTLQYHRETSGRIVIPATVNGQGPFRFALDTGASISAIFTPASDIMQPPLPLTRDIKVQGLIGTGLYPAVHIDVIAVGEARWRDVEAVVLPADGDTTIDGLLGLDFLRDYVVVFPHRERVVHLFHPGQFDASAYAGWAGVPLVARTVGGSGAQLFFLDLEINNTRIPAVLDLGVGFNIMNFAAAALLGLTRETLADNASETVFGALDAAPEVFRVQIRAIAAGNLRWRNESFVIGDLPVFETLVDAGQPAAILGTTLFLRRDLVIDFAHSRLLLERRR